MVSSAIRSQKRVDDLYLVELEIDINGYTICLSIDCVPKPVHDVKALIRNNVLYLELIDNGNRGFATCIVDLEHVTRKCLKCRSLLLPPL